MVQVRAYSASNFRYYEAMSTIFRSSAGGRKRRGRSQAGDAAAGQARVRRIWCQGTPPWLEVDRPSSIKPRRA